jgi:hypothetical protein
LLQEYVSGYQSRRKEVTDEVLELYMKPRKLQWSRSHVLTSPETPAKPTAKQAKKQSKKLADRTLDKKQDL